MILNKQVKTNYGIKQKQIVLCALSGRGGVGEGKVNSGIEWKGKGSNIKVVSFPLFEKNGTYRRVIYYRFIQIENERGGNNKVSKTK